MIESISAITLATHDMQRAVRFYSSLGFEMLYGGETASFTSFRTGPGYLNLIAQGDEKQWSWWGRVIFHVTDVDALYQRAMKAGHRPSTTPRDAEWGERYFHLTDPDGHELSFARPLRRSPSVDVDRTSIGGQLTESERPAFSQEESNVETSSEVNAAKSTAS